MDNYINTVFINTLLRIGLKNLFFFNHLIILIDLYCTNIYINYTFLIIYSLHITFQISFTPHITYLFFIV